MKIFLAVLTICLGVQAFDSFDVGSPDKLENHEVIRKLVELMEKHDLDLQILASENTYNADGVLTEVKALIVDLPENNNGSKGEPLTETIATDFLNLAAKNKFLAGTTLIASDDNNIVYNHKTFSPDYDYVPEYLNIADSYENTKINIGHYFAQYNFIVPGADGKNETYIALAANMEVELVDSKDVEPEVINYIKEMTQKIYLLFTGDVDLGVALAQKVNTKYPNQNWQVVISPGNNYFGEGKKALFKLVDNDTEILFFTL